MLVEVCDADVEAGGEEELHVEAEVDEIDSWSKNRRLIFLLLLRRRCIFFLENYLSLDYFSDWFFWEPEDYCIKQLQLNISVAIYFFADDSRHKEIHGEIHDFGEDLHKHHYADVLVGFGEHPTTTFFWLIFFWHDF